MAHHSAKPVDLTFETPAVHQDAVVIVGDAAYYKAGLLLARQLFEKEQNRSFDICVICSEEIETPPELAKGLRIGSVRFSQNEHFRTTERITAETYVRLFLPDEMSEYRRLCYLDADIYLNRPGVQDLVNIDMENQPIAAVSDFIVWGCQRQHADKKQYREQIAQNPEQYFNAGVLLIDVKKFGLALPPETISALIAERASQLLVLDQTFLNMEFSHRVKLLSLTWNFPMLSELVDEYRQADPILLHFVGGAKPWYDGASGPCQKYHSEYRAFLSKFFGQTDFALPSDRTPPRLSHRKYRNPVRESISRMNMARNLKRKKRRYTQLLAEAMKRYPDN